MAEEENNQRDTDHGPAGNRGAGEEQLNVVAYAHCAAYSCVVTGICVPVLVGSILLGMVKGPALDGGEIVLIGLQYGVLFFLAAVLGRMSRELGVSPLEAMHRLLVWRVVFLLAAMAWASWDGAGGLVVMGAALTVVVAWRARGRGLSASGCRRARCIDPWRDGFLHALHLSGKEVDASAVSWRRGRG